METLKRAVAAVRSIVTEQEPVVVVNAAAAAITGFVADAQGDLTGTHAWVAVGWAALAFVIRELVTPAGRRTA